MNISRAMLLLSLFSYAGVAARADILTLENGSYVSGQCTRDGDAIVMIGDDGQKSKYTKDEYKSCMHESNLNDAGLRRAFEDLDVLAAPVLTEPEPSPREFVEEWNSYTHQLGRFRQANGTVVARAAAPQAPDSSAFLFEWTRYAGLFNAVRDNPTYKRLLTKRKRSGALGEYIRYPPVERADVAVYLGEALGAFEECLDLADETYRLVQLLPVSQTEHDDKIRTARDKYIDKEQDIGVARDQRAARRRANRALKSFLGRVRAMEDDMATAVNSAQSKINLFAQKRTLAELNLAEARAIIEGLPTSSAVGDGTVEGALRQSQAIAKRHRLVAQEKGTNGVKLEVLRERTLNEIKRLFVGRTFGLALMLKEQRDSGSHGHRLRANEISPEHRRHHVSVDLLVPEGVKGSIKKCKAGDKLSLKARVSQMSLTPSLSAWEGSGEELDVLLMGDVVAVTAGCGK